MYIDIYYEIIPNIDHYHFQLGDVAKDTTSIPQIEGREPHPAERSLYLHVRLKRALWPKILEKMCHKIWNFPIHPFGFVWKQSGSTRFSSCPMEIAVFLVSIWGCWEQPSTKWWSTDSNQSKHFHFRNQKWTYSHIMEMKGNVIDNLDIGYIKM